MFANNPNAETLHNSNERPLRMPENYDFSQRKVDWGKYKNDYLLRTDAVWEKSKLFAYFYSLYKAEKVHHEKDKYYDISFEYGWERLKDKDFKWDVLDAIGTDNEKIQKMSKISNGAAWQFDMAPALFKPRLTSQFLGDRTKDGYFLCTLKFHKFMRCNEKSPVKLSEAHISNGTYNDYKCFEELQEMFEYCIQYQFKILFEMYYFRVHNQYFKPMSQQRIYRQKDVFYSPEAAQRKYY